MSTSSLRRLACLLTLAGGLLSGCHSARPSFTFRPAASAPVAAPPPAAPAPPAAPVVPLPSLAAAPSKPTAPSPARVAAHRAAAPLPGPPVLRRALQRARPVARHQASRRRARPAEGEERNVALIVLGAALIVGSVLVGLWLGGWLGLGVGAAIMLLGDYFLVLGIGGKHAWLEIFQEFFNM